MGSTRLLSNDEIKRDLLKGVQDLWKDSLFFDFTLEVEDESIPVHKVILASCSGYFRAMFNSSMKESTERSVELKGLKASAVKSVINFIYTGDIKLSADTIEDVLSAAHYLQIASAVSLCCDYLLEDMTWDSVCHVQHIARIYALNDMEKKVENFLLANFSDMPDEAVESVGKQVLKLTTSNSLCMDSEYELFEKLQLFKTILSEDEFYEALSHVRFPLMSKDELEKVSSTGLMTTRLSHLMDEAWEYHKDVMRQPLLQTERTQVRSDKVTMVVADDSFITGVYVDQPSMDIQTSEPITNQLLLESIRLQEIATVDNFLYVTQTKKESQWHYGIDYSGFFRYDPRFNSWKELKPSLVKDRTCFSLVAHGKQIFAIVSGLTRTLEIYNIQTNEWRFGASINYNCVSCACIVLGDTIYVSGGDEYDQYEDDNEEQYRYVPLNTLSCYDPENDTWQLKAPMYEARSKHQSLAFDGKLFVFAGTNYNISKCTVEYYSPDLNQWTIIHDALPYRIGGVCSNGSDIYILKEDKREERVPADLGNKMSIITMSFRKFNLEKQSTEREGFFVKMRKYCSVSQDSFKCSTLMLPFKLR